MTDDKEETPPSVILSFCHLSFDLARSLDQERRRTAIGHENLAGDVARCRHRQKGNHRRYFFGLTGSLHWNPSSDVGHEFFIRQQVRGKGGSDKSGRNQINPDLMLGPFYSESTGHLI